MTNSQSAKELGRRGGLKRAKILSALRKKQIAALGGRARAKSFLIVRRIETNFRYLNTVQVLAMPASIKTRRGLVRKRSADQVK